MFQGSKSRRRPARPSTATTSVTQPDDSKSIYPVVRVMSSTYHLSQVALRELQRRLRLEIELFPQENLLVEMGSYGSFDVYIGPSKVPVCRTSRDYVYPNISYVVSKIKLAVEENKIQKLAATQQVDDEQGQKEVPEQKQLQVFVEAEDNMLVKSDGSTIAWDNTGQWDGDSFSSRSSASSMEYNSEPADEDRPSVISPDVGAFGADNVSGAASTGESARSVDES